MRILAMAVAGAVIATQASAQDKARLASDTLTAMPMACVAAGPAARRTGRSEELLADLPPEGAYMCDSDREGGLALIATAGTSRQGMCWDIRLVEGDDPVLRLKRSAPAPF